MDLLEFGQEEQYYDMATVSLRASESKIQDLLLGKPVPDPQKHEDLLTLRDVVLREMQTRDFNSVVPPDIQATVHSFLNMVECLCFERAETNPIFAQSLGSLSDFPLEFVPSPDQMAVIGRSMGPAINPAAAIQGTPTTPTSALSSDPNAGVAPPPNIPQPASPSPTANTIAGPPAPPPLPQPPKG